MSLNDKPNLFCAYDGTMTKPYDPALEVVDLCRELIRIDSSNYGDDSGPGERNVAEYIAEKLADVSIESEIYEASPKRSCLMARWGNQNSSKPGLLIHGHMDVVPAQAGDWQVDPFSGEVKDGYVWGRGAVDMKDFNAILLSVVRARQRAGQIPDRPITLIFTADEEAGSQLGGHKLVTERREWFDGITEAVGEVGGFSTEINGQRLYLIETGEKGIAWMKMTAKGRAGHGSMRHDDNAINTLARAITTLGEHEWQVEPGPTMEALVAMVRELTGNESLDLDEVLDVFGTSAKMISAGIRNTTNTTMLSAGYKHNVIPGLAEASVDGRYLPGQRETFVDEVRKVVGPDIEVETLILENALEFPFSGDLVDAMVMALREEDPEAHIAPYLMSGGTDGKAWSRLNINSYGFTPLRLPSDLDFTALFHGVDERVPVDALHFGTKVFDRFLDLV